MCLSGCARHEPSSNVSLNVACEAYIVQRPFHVLASLREARRAPKSWTLYLVVSIRLNSCTTVIEVHRRNK